MTIIDVAIAMRAVQDWAEAEFCTDYSIPAPALPRLRQTVRGIEAARGGPRLWLHRLSLGRQNANYS